MSVFVRKLAKDINGDIDNLDLMALNDTNRAKLITYYIAKNTPQKMDPEDRVKFENEQNKICLKSCSLSSIVGGSCLLFSKFKGQPLFTTVLTLLPLSYFLHKEISSTYNERFVFQSSLMRGLTLKYRFGVFDFQQSRRDRYLQSLRKRIQFENASLLNTPNI